MASSLTLHSLLRTKVPLRHPSLHRRCVWSVAKGHASPFNDVLEADKTNEYTYPKGKIGSDDVIEMCEAVVTQDHRRRIRFFPPMPSEYLSDHLTPQAHWKDHFRGRAVSITPEFLPFWTIAHIAEAKAVETDINTGKIDVLRPSYTTHAGYSLCAVERGHWASDLITMDYIPNMSDLGSRLLGTTALQDLDTFRHYNLRPEVLDETNIPRFARGYPRFDSLAFSRFLDLQSGDVLGMEHKFRTPRRMLLKTPEPFLTFAIPTYRLAYRIDCLDGNIIFADGSWVNEGVNLTHCQSRRGGGGAKIWGAEPDSTMFSALTYEYAPTRDAASQRFMLSPRKSLLACEMILRNAHYGPIEWEDPFILSYVSEHDTKAVELDLYRSRRMRGAKANIPLAYHLPAIVEDPPDPEPLPLPRQALRPPPRRSSKPIVLAPKVASGSMRKPVNPEPRLVPPKAPTAKSSPAGPPAAPIYGDARSYYALLGLVPSARFLDRSPATARAVDEEIKLAFYQTSFMLHPDRRRIDTSEVALSRLGSADQGGDPQGVVNTAREELKDVAGRRIYNEVVREAR